MHRSPLSVLVIFAALAACSARDDVVATEFLSQDPTLVARLEIDRPARQLPLPDACGASTVAAQPAAANRSEADELTRQAYDAEALGRVEEARSLLRRASELDATNKSAAYHLGRTNEALDDRAEALTAYCRYLALTPTTAEAAEARQRVARLSQSASYAVTSSVGDSAPARRRAPAATARRVTRARPAVTPRVVASTAVEHSTPAASLERSMRSASAVTSIASDSPAPRDPVTTSPEGDGATDSAATGGEVVATPAPTSTVDVHQPPTAVRTESRGPSRAQRAGIGAAAGAIIGAATGRGVKGAVIGAAAGGMLGTVMGSGIRPVGRGIQPWAARAY